MRQHLSLALLCVFALACACAPAERAEGARPAAERAPGTAAAPTPLGADALQAPSRVKYAIAATSLNFLPAKIAVEQGFYRQHGLDVEMIVAGAGAATAAQLSGELEYTTAYPSAVRAIGQGAPLRIVSVLVSAPLFVMLARPEIATLADLRGQTVGITTRGGAQDKVTRDLLATIGLDADNDVSILPAGGQTPLLVDALVNGRVKAAALSAPWHIRARQQGMRVLASAPELIREPQNGLVVTQDRLMRQREQVLAMVQAEVAAVRFLRANRPAVVAISREWLEISQEEAEEAYDFVLPAYALDGAVDVAAMERFLATEAKEGNIPAGLQVEQVADLTLAPEAVRILDARQGSVRP